MAWTVSAIVNTVPGDKRSTVFKVTTDSAEALVATGYSWVDYHLISPIKYTDAVFTAYPNSGTTGTAIGGSIGFSGCASGDIFFLQVFGH